MLNNYFRFLGGITAVLGLYSIYLSLNFILESGDLLEICFSIFIFLTGACFLYIGVISFYSIEGKLILNRLISLMLFLTFWSYMRESILASIIREKNDYTFLLFTLISFIIAFGVSRTVFIIHKKLILKLHQN